MTVTYQVLNISDGGGSENLLINPRGKINQANESDGVLSAGQYFCDGWKAGAAGAEVYRDADGFRLISGSILQLIPNNLDAGRKIKGNLDAISGSPIIRINGGTDSELSNDQAYIKFEVTGNNSKFTRLILAESDTMPIYQQAPDELSPCLPFLRVLWGRFHIYDEATFGAIKNVYMGEFHSKPAVSASNTNGQLTATNTGFSLSGVSSVGAKLFTENVVLDARL